MSINASADGHPHCSSTRHHSPHCTACTHRMMVTLTHHTLSSCCALHCLPLCRCRVTNKTIRISSVDLIQIPGVCCVDIYLQRCQELMLQDPADICSNLQTLLSLHHSTAAHSEPAVHCGKPTNNQLRCIVLI